MQLIREVYGFVKFDSVAHEKFRVHLNEEVEGVGCPRLSYRGTNFEETMGRLNWKRWEGRQRNP